MCLSKVFQIIGDDKKQIAEYVSKLQHVDDKIILTDIMGIETVVTGTVTGVDLVGNQIVIQS